MAKEESLVPEIKKWYELKYSLISKESFFAVQYKTGYEKYSLKSIVKALVNEPYYKKNKATRLALLQEVHNKYAKLLNIFPVGVRYKGLKSKLEKEVSMYVDYDLIKHHNKKTKEQYYSNIRIGICKINKKDLKALSYNELSKKGMHKNHAGIIYLYLILHETRHVYQSFKMQNVLLDTDDEMRDYEKAISLFGRVAQVLISYEGKQYDLNLLEIDSEIFALTEMLKQYKNKTIQNNYINEFFIMKRILLFLSYINNPENQILSFKYAKSEILKNINIIKKKLHSDHGGLYGKKLQTVVSQINIPNFMQELGAKYKELYDSLKELQSRILNLIKVQPDLKKRMLHNRIDHTTLNYLLNNYYYYSDDYLKESEYTETIVKTK